MKEDLKKKFLEANQELRKLLTSQPMDGPIVQSKHLQNWLIEEWVQKQTQQEKNYLHPKEGK